MVYYHRARNYGFGSSIMCCNLNWFVLMKGNRIWKARFSKWIFFKTPFFIEKQPQKSRQEVWSVFHVTILLYVILLCCGCCIFCFPKKPRYTGTVFEFFSQIQCISYLSSLLMYKAIYSWEKWNDVQVLS
jgi:hypothetical protein